MEKKPNKKAVKLAKAFNALADKIDSGEFKWKHIRPGTVFDKSGFPCCAVGHAICLAKLEGAMGSFSYSWGGTKWWGSVEVIEHLTKAPVDRYLQDRLFRLETASDDGKKNQTAQFLRQAASRLATL